MRKKSHWERWCNVTLGETRKRVKKVKIGFTEDVYKEARELADKLAEGNLSRLIRELVDSKYKEVFGGGEK
jgi:hypothetical protein